MGGKVFHNMVLEQFNVLTTPTTTSLCAYPIQELMAGWSFYCITVMWL
jgi:hypothetical protein